MPVHVLLLSYVQGSGSLDYLTRIAKKKERRRADPVVTLSSLLETVLNGIRDLPEVSSLTRSVVMLCQGS